MRIRFAIAMCAALLAAPAGARAADPIASGGGQGSGWASVWFASDGSPASVTIEANNVTQPGAATGLLFTPAGQYLGGANVIVVSGMGGVRVQSEPAPGVGVDLSHESVRLNGFTASVTLRVNAPGTAQAPGQWKAMLIASGGAQSWSWRLDGGAGVSLLGSESGATTYAFTSRDLSGAASVTGLAVGAGAHVQVDASRTVEAVENLFGVYWGLAPTGVNQISMTTPTETRSCICVFGSPAEHPPGVYGFHLTGAGAGLASQSEIYIGLADARLPG